MFVRIVKSGKNSYVRLVEGYRDKQTGKVCQRTVSNLFKLDGDADKKIAALKKFLDSETCVRMLEEAACEDK